MHDDEVLLHALDGLSQLRHQLLVGAACGPVALPLLPRASSSLGVGTGLLALLACLTSLLGDAVEQVLGLPWPVVACKPVLLSPWLLEESSHQQQMPWGLH